MSAYLELMSTFLKLMSAYLELMSAYLELMSAYLELMSTFLELERPKRIIISMKQNSNLNHFGQLLFHTFSPPLDKYNLFGLTKNGCQNRSSGAKAKLLGWAGAKS